MKSLVLAAALLTPLCAAAQTAANATPMSTMNTFVNAFNKGDMATVHAVHSADGVTIIDEDAPYIWQGKGALDAWLAMLDNVGKAKSQSENAVALRKPQVLNVSGNRAYAVVPVEYTWKEKGVPMHEPATMTIVLHRGPAGWKIDAWSWNGTPPQRVGK
ncbi:nuclear transport factor 2 family protein [Terriglobus sp. TAA 43]|uniref:YybH family protein n=1 Tax=Terriglobus sp. TAA 43 TaxID=278961 RepID=UPI00064799BD|nr:nuclear transport factor 2 family protein [Terriglobus sp. TAA 43]